MGSIKSIIIVFSLLLVAGAAYAAGNDIVLQTTGNCLEKPVIASATVGGNPLEGATIEAKNSSTSSNFITDSSGTVSVMFNEAGIYEFKATKGTLSSDSIAIQVASCEAKPVVDLCSSVNCDDSNPCTVDSCSEGVCNNANLEGTACGNGTCSAGACVQAVSAAGNETNATGTTGFLGLGEVPGDLIIGIIIMALIFVGYLFLRMQILKE